MTLNSDIKQELDELAITTRNAGLKNHKLESRLPGEISITSGMQMIPPSWQKEKKN